MDGLSLTRITGAITVALAITATACNRDPAGPELQTSSGVQPRMESVTVDGCLRGGLAENTFVLMSEQDGTETATYQLLGPTEQLRDHIGQRVQVSGTLRAEQEVASTGVDAVDDPARGTSGTPTIETKTELNMKHMTVDSVTPSGQRCAD